MKINYLIPSLNPHGGIRVLVEHCNGLARKGHDVTLTSLQGPMRNPGWVKIEESVKLRFGGGHRVDAEAILVAGSPPVANQIAGFSNKKVFFLQMAEHLFVSPSSGAFKDWNAQCVKSYQFPGPIIGISKWVEEEVFQVSGRRIDHYIGNGVGDEFSYRPEMKERILLVEGWEGYNFAKDTLGIAPKIAERIRAEYPDIYIIAYSGQPISTRKDVPHEYYQAPSNEILVQLYQRATVMLKASRYDARSCAPVEAMACGTPTVRLLSLGDDDLNANNSIRFPYDANFMDEATNSVMTLFENSSIRNALIKSGLEYREKELRWEKWISKLEEIYGSL